MNLSPTFTPEAADELREAMNWSDEEQPGLGGDLLTEVETTIQHVLRWPELAPQRPVADVTRQVRRDNQARINQARITPGLAWCGRGRV